MSMAMVSASHINKWGNSQGVRLSKNILKQLHWQDNEQVTIHYSSNQIVIERAQSLLEKLFANYKNTEYKPSEIDWGEDIGGEKF